MIPPASPPGGSRALPIVSDVVSASTCTWRSPTSPACWRSVAQVLGRHGVSVKSVVQKGLSEQARLVMVTHPVLESQLLSRRSTEIAGLDAMRGPPRAIRVIEEEFVMDGTEA